MIAQDVPDADGPESEVGAADRLDRNHVVVDVVSLKAFLAALKEDTPPKERLVALVRTPPPLTE